MNISRKKLKDLILKELRGVDTGAVASVRALRRRDSLQKAGNNCRGDGWQG